MWKALQYAGPEFDSTIEKDKIHGTSYILIFQISSFTESLEQILLTTWMNVKENKQKAKTTHYPIT